MEEVIKLIILSSFVASSIYMMVATARAYRNRKDKSFFGGAMILNGWWVIYPYGSSGINEENHKIVFHGRVAYLCFYSACLLMYLVIIKQ